MEDRDVSTKCLPYTMPSAVKGMHLCDERDWPHLAWPHLTWPGYLGVTNSKSFLKDLTTELSDEGEWELGKEGKSLQALTWRAGNEVIKLPVLGAVWRMKGSLVWLGGSTGQPGDGRNSPQDHLICQPKKLGLSNWCLYLSTLVHTKANAETLHVKQR